MAVQTYRSKPVFMDGLTTTKSYLVLATNPSNPTFNCICIRKVGSNNFKLKLYPDVGGWGFSIQDLYAMGFTSHLHRTNEGHHYDRFFCNERQIHHLMNQSQVRGNALVLAVADHLLIKAFEDWEAHRDDCIYETTERQAA